MVVDLHTHSRVSDGSDTPTELVERAVVIGLEAIALTDHDTLEGVPEAVAAATDRVEVVPGVELSVDWRGRAMHLLVYWVQPSSGPLQDRLEALRRSRERRNHEIVAALQQQGIDISMDEVAARSGGGVTGRPHIAAVLVDRGHVATISEAFDRFLASGRPAYRPRARLEAAKAVELAHASGGVAAVAHPHTVADNADDFAGLFRDLVTLGVDGIECHYSEYRPQQRQALAEMTERLGLVATGGSDHHGSYKPDIQLGIGRGDLEVPIEALEGLRARRR